MGRGLTDKSAVLTGIFIHKTAAAVRLRLEESADPKEDLWIPMSQITQIIYESGNFADYNNIEVGETYLWRITGWIALKLFDCEGWEELVELDLSFLDTEE